MRNQRMSFMGADVLAQSLLNKCNKPKSFDWLTAAKIIKARFAEDSGIRVEAGLCDDWAYTGGCIFENGEPNVDDYTYLSSTWATPAMIITMSNGDEIEIPCFESEGKYHSDSKWPEESLNVINTKQLNP